ncbi:MAG: hypothetical protein K0A94_06545 [Desulfuromonadales bacterium]|nr:hypothetical protein [Desulfuromonadales bacterium]
MKRRIQSEAGTKPHESRQQKIRDLRDNGHHLARHNLWELFLFLLVSICAYNVRDLNLFAMASEPLRQLLGYPPPAYMVSIALAVYFGSSIILGLKALASRSRPESTWNHLGYRSAFYFFYSFTGGIADHFLPVLLVGLLLYGLDQCHLRCYNQGTIHGFDGASENM